MSSKWMKIGIASALVVVIGLASLSAVAFAAGNSPAAGGGYGMGGRWGGAQGSLVAAAAQVLHMDQTELVAQLNSGQTLAQVAQAHGSSAEALLQAWLAPRQQALSQAMAAGQLTQAKADAMLANMRASAESQINSPWVPKGQGAGQGFVDANGDGVCDFNTLQAHMPRGRGQR